MWDTSQRFMCGGTEKHDVVKDREYCVFVCRIWAVSVWVEIGVCFGVYVCLWSNRCVNGGERAFLWRDRVYLHKWVCVCVCVKGETEMDVCERLWLGVEGQMGTRMRDTCVYV